MYICISHKERARAINNSKETAREFAEIAQNETNVLMCVCVGVCMGVSAYILSHSTDDGQKTPDRSRQTAKIRQ